MQVCPRCGDRNSDRARFCQTCGGRLSSEPAEPRETRKNVTILFTDVVGSTELGERLDPESIRRVMSRFFDVVRPALEHHGGTVAKFIGDAVMAVFGIPAVHEDDALRACRAALETQDELGQLNKELERDWGVTLSTRTGLNTGEVISDPSAESLVIGDPVNTAARLEQAAPPGTVLIGESTYGLVAGAVEVESIEPVVAKGKAEAVAAYRLLSVVTGVPQRAGRLDAAMVGRGRDLGILREAFERSIAELRCVICTVVGMPGVGKSRLVQEFVASMVDRASVVRGRCLPYGEGITFWPVASVVHEAARIAEGDSPEEARSRIESLLPEVDDRAVVVERVAAAIGLEDATSSMQETFWAIRKLLEAVARDRPLIVVFDDIHWGEPVFLDLVEYLEGWSRGTAILVLCLSRPELLETRPTWATTVALDPLTQQETDHLISNLLGSNAVSDDLRRRIAETAEGNPLFVEEMLGMLIDDERLRREEGRWVAVGDLSTVPTPRSIQSLLAARIEQLPETERAVLQAASVVGKVFWWGAVAELAPAPYRRRVGSDLQDLVRKGMVRPDESSFAGQDAFRFRHILIRDAAYGSLPRGTRAEQHERLAAWIERTLGDRIDEYEEIVAYHLEQAYRFRSEVEPAAQELPLLRRKAADRLSSVGLRASAREDFDAAQNLLSRAVQLWPSDDLEGRVLHLLRLIDLLYLTGEFSNAEAVLAQAIDAARSTGDPALETRAEIRRTRLRSMIDPTRTAQEALDASERAAAVLEELGDEAGSAEAWEEVGKCRQGLGRYREGEVALERSREFAERAGDRWMQIRPFDPSPWTGQGPGTALEESARAREALELGTERRSQRALARLSLALHLSMQGHLGAGREEIDVAHATFEELGLRFDLAAAVGLVRAQVEMLAGDPVAAHLALRPGIEFLQATGSTGVLSSRAAFMSRILYQQGRYDEALEFAEMADRNAARGDMEPQLWFRGVRAEVLARTGELEAADRAAREVVKMAERTDWLNFQGDVFLDLAEVMRLSGRPNDAADAAEQAVDRFERKGNVVAAGLARALVGELRP
jgi:class 3 adenylate cyclase/tetratricopeptide (TPR) repeat protein